MPYLKKNGIPKCRKPGVYVITNKVNGKVYVGSAVSIEGRLGQHRSYLRGGSHGNIILQHSWNKHGESAFKFDVLETCDPSLTLVKEQFWMDKMRAYERETGYNICPIAGNAMGGRNHSEESKALMSAQRKGIIPVAATEAAALASKGKKHSAERVAERANTRRGRKNRPEVLDNMRTNHWSNGLNADEIGKKISAKKKGKPQSEESNRKRSETQKGRPKSKETRQRISEGRKLMFARMAAQNQNAEDN